MNNKKGYLQSVLILAILTTLVTEVCTWKLKMSFTNESAYSIRQVDFSHDGQYVAATIDVFINVYSLASGKMVWRDELFPGGDSKFTTTVRFSPRGDYLAAGIMNSKFFHAYKLPDFSKLGSWDTGFRSNILYDIDFNYDGSKMIICGKGAEVYVYDFDNLSNKLIPDLYHNSRDGLSCKFDFE